MDSVNNTRDAGGSSGKWIATVANVPVPLDEWTDRLDVVPSLPFALIGKYLEEGASQAPDGGGDKARREGWVMHREEHVRSLSLHGRSDRETADRESHAFVRALVRASFRVRVQYRVVCALFYSPAADYVATRVRAYCSCPAGTLGSCKHVAATLFHVWDLQQLGVTVVPPSKTSTDVAAYWMEPSGSRQAETSSRATRWKDFLFVKHKCPAMGENDSTAHVLRERSENVALARRDRRASHESLPIQHRLVTSGSIAALCDDLENLGSNSVVTGLLRSNGCQSTLHRLDAVVFHDHPFLRGSQPSLASKENVHWPTCLLSPAPTVPSDFLLRTLLGAESGCMRQSLSKSPANPTGGWQ